MYFFRVVLIFVLLFDETHAGDVILAVLGNTVLLECKIPQTDTMIWDRPDGTVIAIKGIIQPGINETKFVLQSSSKLQSLSIHELELPDDGVYRCYDLAHAGTKQEFTVNIFVRPTYFRVRGPDTGVDEGSEYEFRCEVDGGKPPPFIRWHISGPNTNGSSFSGINQDTLHSNGTIFRRNILRLRVTREMYQASVICDSSIEYFYQVQQTTVLNVSLFPLEPSFDIFTGLYDDGKVTTITCRSKGSRPAANIYWILNGRRVNSTSNEVKRLADGTFDVTGTLVKKLTKTMENQTLSCAVTNPVLVRSRKPHLLKTVILLPNYAPSIVGDNGTRTVEERISLSLTCIIRSRPLPKTVDPLWFHNDAPISTGQYYNITRIDLSLSQLVTTLAILHIKKDLSGRYNCQAFNHLGSARGLPMNIEVLYRPVCLFSGVHKYAVRLGSSVKFTCPVVANPNNVTMSWRYVQRNLPIKSSLIGDVDSQTRSSTSILIDVVSDRQYSDVACVATNRLGDMMIPCLYRIVEPSPPEIPSNCSSTTISDSELRVECSPGFNGGSPQHFLLQLKDVTNFRTVMNQSSPVFIKRDLIPNTNYTFRICAATSAFTKTISCASPLSASTFIGAVGQKRVTTEVESASITPYIIGGVVGFIFLVVLISVIACFLHKKRKVGKESEEVLDTPKPSQNNTPSMPSITDCFTHAQFQSVVNFPKNVENDVFHRQSDPADPSLVRVAKINTSTDASKKSQYEYQVKSSQHSRPDKIPWSTCEWLKDGGRATTIITVPGIRNYAFESNTPELPKKVNNDQVTDVHERDTLRIGCHGDDSLDLSPRIGSSAFQENNTITIKRADAVTLLALANESKARDLRVQCIDQAFIDEKITDLDELSNPRSPFNQTTSNSPRHEFCYSETDLITAVGTDISDNHEETSFERKSSERITGRNGENVNPNNGHKYINLSYSNDDTSKHQTHVDNFCNESEISGLDDLKQTFISKYTLEFDMNRDTSFETQRVNNSPVLSDNADVVKVNTSPASSRSDVSSGQSDGRPRRRSYNLAVSSDDEETGNLQDNCTKESYRFYDYPRKDDIEITETISAINDDTEHNSGKGVIEEMNEDVVIADDSCHCDTACPPDEMKFGNIIDEIIVSSERIVEAIHVSLNPEHSCDSQLISGDVSHVDLNDDQSDSEDKSRDDHNEEQAISEDVSRIETNDNQSVLKDLPHVDQSISGYVSSEDLNNEQSLWEDVSPQIALNETSEIQTNANDHNVCVEREVMFTAEEERFTEKQCESPELVAPETAETHNLFVAYF